MGAARAPFPTRTRSAARRRRVCRQAQMDGGSRAARVRQRRWHCVQQSSNDWAVAVCAAKPYTAYYELRKDYMRKTILVLLASIGGVAGQVVPFVECVSFDPATNLLVATWGYTNSSSSAVIFPFGAKNFFSPPPSVQGQPATFQPGMHHRLFQTVIDLTVDSS